jgi:PPOX class probable F420-dependent enzyme
VRDSNQLTNPLGLAAREGKAEDGPLCPAVGELTIRTATNIWEFIMIDLSSDFGAYVNQRLGDEGVIWLTTVAADGTPQPNPVWFLWDNNSFLIYTKPDSAKLKNIKRNPRVSLNLEGATSQGGEVMVITGIASIEEHAPEPNPKYYAKYKGITKKLGREFADVYREYSISIRVMPLKLRGF